MDKPVIKKQGQSVVVTKPSRKDSEPSLKGTFASVMIVGGVILITWVLVFLLFIHRT
ncbi:cytochrome c oxidase subunit 2A [Paenibacillus albiflavus]|uniref:Cytochrome c oxidase subunit 2A n=1 Tax=Paenibacillus albiflavus TaxID=2545760 RepID=A0A4V6P655_9BACL|nr:cytochrome c oxidase subunit 2A [Paenibacillus albiflavus]TCZ67523.1 cytochrome c oxidase subunit 2A [Paenibacillus albiflavus]